MSLEEDEEEEDDDDDDEEFDEGYNKLNFSNLLICDY